MKPRIVVIGGSGAAGTVIVQGLSDRFHCVVVDPKPPSGRISVEWYEAAAVDLPSGYLRAGDVVVYAATGSQLGWRGLLATEVEGLRHVALEAASQDVGRFIMLSSSRVAFGVERDISSTDYRDVVLATGRITPATVRPGDEYGAAKAFGEAFVRMLAEAHGLPVSVLRIGTLRIIDDPAWLASRGISDMPMPTETLRRRLRSTWLKHADLLRLLMEEVQAVEPFRRRYAISADARETWLPLDVETWSP